MEEEEGEGDGGSDPEYSGGDGGGVRPGRALAACIDEFHPEEDEDEEVKTYPVADGSCARHLSWMLQRRRVGCTIVRCGTVRKERGGRFAAEASMLRGRTADGASLARADDHGVDPIKCYCQHQPENGGEKQAAHDLAYRVDVEEAPVRTAVGEAFCSGL